LFVNKTLLFIIKLIILLLVFPSVNQWSDLPIGSTFVWWAVQIVLMIAVVVFKNTFPIRTDFRNLWPVYLMLIWNVISMARGIGVAENYWEWKQLVDTSLILIMPLLVFLTVKKFTMQEIIPFWFKAAIPLFIVMIPFMNQSDFIGQFFAPLVLALLFFHNINSKWKVVLLLILLFVLILGLDARSNLIKFVVSLLLGLLVYFGFLLNKRILKLVFIIMLVIPWIFLYLGVYNIFNVFEMDEYLGEYKASASLTPEEEVKLTNDTRTFVYEEVLISAVKDDYWLLGRTPARGYNSDFFGAFQKHVLKTGKMERFSSEVSIHNVFTWTGLVGVVLFMLVFAIAAFLALFRSNSLQLKIIGLFVLFRWIFAFVEDFSRFDLNTVILWLLIGMCFSVEFRSMSDRDIKIWVLSIFDKRFKLLPLYLKLKQEQENEEK
jgi:hypothetical protein